MERHFLTDGNSGCTRCSGSAGASLDVICAANCTKPYLKFWIYICEILFSSLPPFFSSALVNILLNKLLKSVLAGTLFAVGVPVPLTVCRAFVIFHLCWKMSSVVFTLWQFLFSQGHFLHFTEHQFLHCNFCVVKAFLANIPHMQAIKIHTRKRVGSMQGFRYLYLHQDCVTRKAWESSGLHKKKWCYHQAMLNKKIHFYTHI